MQKTKEKKCYFIKYKKELIKKIFILIKCEIYIYILIYE